MYSYSAIVDKGIFEQQNDDRAYIAHRILNEETCSGVIEEEYFLSAVCDGVGGLEKGFVGAEMTLEMLAFLDRKNVTKEVVKKAVEEANRRILNRKAEENLTCGMCTTVAGCYVHNNKFLVFNAGDSRVYRLHEKYLILLSKDHSLVQNLVDTGEISVIEAGNHPEKNVITKCIGNSPQVNTRVVDFSDSFCKGDILLICSDGITDCMSDKEIKQCMLEYKDGGDLTECSGKIIEKAKNNGSKDNISVILIRKDS